VIQNERANPPLRISFFLKPLPQALHDGSERVFLDEIEQALFGFEVVVHARERHAAVPRQVPHGCAFIALFVENVGGVRQDLCQTPVKTAFGCSECQLATRHRRRRWKRIGSHLVRTFVLTNNKPNLSAVATSPRPDQRAAS